MSGRHGAQRNVQRALGWTDNGERRPPQAHCAECGELLAFGIPDPLGIGRSMQQCTNPECDGHTPHVMTRADYTELT